VLNACLVFWYLLVLYSVLFRRHFILLSARLSSRPVDPASFRGHATIYQNNINTMLQENCNEVFLNWLPNIEKCVNLKCENFTLNTIEKML